MAPARLQPGGAFRCQCLLLHDAMPGLNGVETARRPSETHPGLITILISGYSDADRLSSHWQGAVLRKPFGFAELSAALSRYLRSDKNVIACPCF
jgi:DNA-binding response OmpR family regulator